MGLSSTVLWHQTKRDAFFKILSSRRLYYSYSQEFVLTKNPDNPIAFPMISLCDLPLSEFASNNWTYGDFAIGFSQNWGSKNRFTPVCYCNKNSIFLKRLIDSLNKNRSPEINNKILYCCAYLKYVQGPLKTSKKSFTNYKFYDEREERLILDPEENKGIKFILYGDEYNQYKRDNKNSSLVNNKFVEFENKDIRYIVANSNENIAKAKRILFKDTENIDNIVFLTKSQVTEDIIGANHNVEEMSNENDKENIYDQVYNLLLKLKDKTV